MNLIDSAMSAMRSVQDGLASALENATALLREASERRVAYDELLFRVERLLGAGTVRYSSLDAELERIDILQKIKSLREEDAARLAASVLREGPTEPDGKVHLPIVQTSKESQ